MSDTKKEKSLKERERSINNLQHLCIIVIGLAITVSLKDLCSDIFGNGIFEVGKGLFNFKDYYAHLLRFISFIITVIPFFHGANRYLDRSYITVERNVKKYALIIDFSALFIEALAIYILATYANIDNVFYIVLALLLIFDIIWVGSTYFTSREERKDKSKIIKWASINFLAAFSIFISLGSVIFKTNWTFWSNEYYLNYMLAFICVARTFFDYYLVWDLYYPNLDQIPAPYPAPPPEQIT